jgi:hypothetical protein
MLGKQASLSCRALHAALHFLPLPCLLSCFCTVCNATTIRAYGISAECGTDVCSACTFTWLPLCRPAIMIAYLISGLIATLTALCYAE